MCYRLFIASDRELPVVAPTRPTPTFHAALVPPEVVAGLPFPSGWRVVQAGSTSGCACDFHDDDDPTCRQRLVEYLRPLAGKQKLQVYSTWYGDEADRYDVQSALMVDGLLAAGDPIPQQTLTTIT